jgi:TonB family protein
MKRSLFIAAFMILVGTSPALPSATDDDPLQLPVPVRAMRPPYSARALAGKISGVVLIDVRVNSNGNVVEANIVMGPEFLRDGARAAARAWLFKARADRGPYTVRLTFIFHDRAFVAPPHKPDFTSPFQMEIPYPEEQF